MLGKIAPLGVLLIVFILSFRPITDSDLWWHLATGRFIIENREIPTKDFYSHTNSGREWIDHEWLSQAFFYAIYDQFGLSGIVFLKASLTIIGLGLLYKRSLLLSGNFFALVALVTAAELSRRAWIERPLMFTFAFLSLSLYLLESHAKGQSNRLWMLPFLVAVWANLHGGFIIGILVILIYAIGFFWSGERQKSKNLLIVAFVSTLAALFNPYTYRGLLYPFQYAQQSIHARFIMEWQSPTFHTLTLFEIMLLLAIIIAAKHRIENIHILLTVTFAHLALFAERNISLFALVCAPIILAYTERIIAGAIDPNYAPRKFDLTLIENGLARMKIRRELASGIRDRFIPAFSYVFVVLAIGSFLYYSFGQGNAFQVSPEGFPEKAVDFLAASEQKGNLFNIYHWGGYCIWRLHPKYKVFIDGRADMYGDFVFEYLSVHRTESRWRETLEKYGVSVVLIPANFPLDVLLKESEDWREVYRDEMAVVYRRNE